MTLKLFKKCDMLSIRNKNYGAYNQKQLGDFGGEFFPFGAPEGLFQALPISPFYGEQVLFDGSFVPKKPKIFREIKKEETWSYYRSPDKVTGYTGSNGLIPASRVNDITRLIKANSSFLLTNKFYYLKTDKGIQSRYGSRALSKSKIEPKQEV